MGYNSSFFDTVGGREFADSLQVLLRKISQDLEESNELKRKEISAINQLCKKFNQNNPVSEPKSDIEKVDSEDSIRKNYFDDEYRLKVRLIAAEICEEFEDFLDENGHIMIPDDDREGDEGEALLYGSTYDEVESNVQERISDFFREVINEGLATGKIDEVATDIFWNIFMPIYEKNKPEKENDFVYIFAQKRKENISYLIGKIAHYLINVADEESEDFYIELNEEEY